MPPWRGFPLRIAAVTLTVVASLAITACSGSSTRTASTTSTTQTTFCQVYPRFANELNLALANANPDVRQYTVVDSILAHLEPTIRQLRAVEPPALKGTVDAWASEMHKYATGNYPVTAAESERTKMADWVKTNC